MQYNDVVHHGDDDGYCAAAIIIGQCIPTTVSEDRTFSYWHGDEVPAIQYDKVTETDRLFILDLALDDVMLGIIRKFREAAPKGTIIHIDHHKSTFEKLNALSPEDKELMSSVIQYYRIGLSGCLLAWIWTSMHEDEQQHPDDVPFDFMPQMTHVGLWPEGYGGHEERLYPIPSIVRWINDWDVWTHELPDTTEFHYGNTSDCDCVAWHVAVKLMKYPESQCQVIVPSKLGFSDDQTTVTPYVYILKIKVKQ